MACRHHAADEQCADCDGSIQAQSGRPVDRQRGLVLAREARRKLHERVKGESDGLG